MLIFLCRDYDEIISIGEIIESNEAGIYVNSLLCSQLNPLKAASDHSCGSEYIKRYISFSPMKNGCVLFFLNRYITEGYIRQIIYPDEEMLIGDKFLQLTTTTSFSNEHFAVTVTMEGGKMVLYDDLKPTSTVC